MKTDWWEKIERAYHVARDLDGEERSRFLDDVCGTDATMRRQMEALLEQDQVVQVCNLDSSWSDVLAFQQ